MGEYGISIKDFGATGDGVVDDTAAIQAAMDAAQASGGTLYAPAGVYRCIYPIMATQRLSIVGDGAEPMADFGNASTPRSRGKGTWFFFDHPGVGISIAGATPRSGFVLRDFGTFRNQPANIDDVSWQPLAADWDILLDNAEALVENIVLLNPTKGFRRTRSGRLTVNVLRMQAFNVGIQIDEVFDVCRLNNIHIWPFWAEAAVTAYTLANLNAIVLGRCDNPQLSNIFTIFARCGLQIVETTSGSVNKLLLTNGDFDRGINGIEIMASGVTARLANVSMQGESNPGSANSGIKVNGNNSRIQCTNLSIENVDGNAIRCNGMNNKLALTNVDFIAWNKSALGFPAVEAASGNRVSVSGEIYASAGGGGSVLGGSGSVGAFLGSGQVSATPNASGDITVTHGLIETPRVIITATDDPTLARIHSVHSKGASTFKVRVRGTNGAIVTSGVHNISWAAWY